MAIADQSDALYGFTNQQFTVAPTKVTVNATTNRNLAVLTVGHYVMISDTACYVLQGGSTVNATSSSHYLPADLEQRFPVVDAATGYVAVIQKDAAGSLFIRKAH